MNLQDNRLHVALVGTRGVPAHYGGFETAVEEVGRRLAARGHRVTVYCRRNGGPTPDEYLGMELVHLPAAPRRSLETLTHTGLSAVDLLRRRVDVALVFNAANAVWLPVIRAARIPVATHVDGLEWKRDKWGAVGKRYYLVAERMAVRWSDALIADAPGISRYYRSRYDADTVEIAYGAPQVGGDCPRLGELGLEPRGYHLVVARFEPENHVDLIIDGYVRSQARLPLIVVGSAPYSADYTKRCTGLAREGVRFLGGVWDQELLDQLYAGCCTYLHGHSVGGTNPSLLRAIGAGAAVAAHDNEFNRDVLLDAGNYWSDAAGVRSCVESAEAAPDRLAQLRAASRARSLDYSWDEVADRYEHLCEELLNLRSTLKDSPGVRRSNG